MSQPVYKLRSSMAWPAVCETTGLLFGTGPGGRGLEIRDAETGELLRPPSQEAAWQAERAEQEAQRADQEAQRAEQEAAARQEGRGRQAEASFCPFPGKAPESRPGAAPPRRSWESLPQMPEEIRKLDAERYNDSAGARKKLRWELFNVADGDRPLSWGLPLLAVYGSALRMDAKLLDQAQLTLMAAYEIAEKNGDASTLGNMVQRSAYVVADRGEHHQALDLAKRAAGFYILAHDLTGIGKTLVDQGGWLRYLSRFQESAQVNMAALKYLPEGETPNRFCALACLG